MYIVAAYLTYLVISVALTLSVGSALRRNGRIFLVEAFRDSDLADSVNRLLVVGFYLVNIGFVTLALRTSGDLQNARQAIELVCGKTGAALLVLGLMHFANLYIFHRLRQRGRDRDLHVRRRPEPEHLGRVLD